MAGPHDSIASETPGRPEPAPEDALMLAYIDGDARAFERLFALLGPRVHAFFERTFRSRAVADDLMQTTFLKLHKARGEFRRGSAVRPWLFAIAARVRLDELRRRQRLGPDVDEEALARLEERAAVEADAPPDLDAPRRAAAVRAALDALPESQRVVVLLHRYEELTFAQIAETLGSTEGAVKLRAFRAYEQLRKRLRPWSGAEVDAPGTAADPASTASTASTARGTA